MQVYHLEPVLVLRRYRTRRRHHRRLIPTALCLTVFRSRSPQRRYHQTGQCSILTKLIDQLLQHRIKVSQQAIIIFLPIPYLTYPLYILAPSPHGLQLHNRVVLIVVPPATSVVNVPAKISKRSPRRRTIG